MARHSVLVRTLAPVKAQVEDEAAGGLYLTGVAICKYFPTGLTPTGQACEPHVGSGETTESEADGLDEETCEPVVQLKLAPSEAGTATSGVDELARDATIGVMAEDTGEPLRELKLTLSEEETAVGGVDKLAVTA